MAVLLQIKNAYKSYGDQVLLDGAEATITDDVKVGFVGRNGAGKSTLLRVLLGEEELDRGEVIRHPKLRLGYLRQHDPFLPGETALEFLMRDSGQPDWKCGEVAGQFELKGDYLEGPDRQALRRLADARQAGGPAAARAELAAAGRTDELSRPAHADSARAFSAEFSRGLPDRVARSGLPGRHLHPHARSVARQADDVSRQDRRLSRNISASGASTTSAPTPPCWPSGGSSKSSSPRTRPGPAPPRGPARRASSSNGWKSTEIAGDEPTANIRAPIVEPRKGPALRCRELAIGYPEREIASGIDLEIEHGSRAAIVGDNGQGKTTFLRTVVDSLEPLAGEVRWGYGCQIGVYAQHVYTSLPEQQTVLDYLEYNAAPGTKNQAILDLAGALLFRGEQVKKRIAVLSGGERARLCLAGLLLSQYNVLVLDEPGNHLDVDTVEALAEALLEYKGTVIFTSHDRHFMKRVATCIIEVRDGHVTNYRGDYDAYLYSVNKEIDDGEREATNRLAKMPPSVRQSLNR